MSATRDKTQKFTFVYANLYQLYRKGQMPAAPKADAPIRIPGSPAGLTTARVIKAGSLKAGSLGLPKHVPTEFMAKRLSALREAEAKKTELKIGLATRKTQSDALDSLKQNLKNLNELHSRLRFMLKELEDLVRE